MIQPCTLLSCTLTSTTSFAGREHAAQNCSHASHSSAQDWSRDKGGPCPLAAERQLTGTSCTDCRNKASASSGPTPTLQEQHFSRNSQRGPLWGKAPVARQQRSSSFGCSRPLLKQVSICQLGWELGMVAHSASAGQCQTPAQLTHKASKFSVACLSRDASRHTCTT